MDSYNELYRQLPNESGENFRLNQISRWMNSLEKELETRQNIHKKYNRTRALLLNTSKSCGTLSVILGASGLGTGLTGVGLPTHRYLSWSCGWCLRCGVNDNRYFC